MRGTHGFSTDQPRRRRITFFACGAAGVVIANNLGPVLASMTGFDFFHNITISFVLASTIVYYVVSRVLWKFDPISKLIGSPPDLNGQWEGYLYTDTEEYDPEAVVSTNQLGLDLVQMNASMSIRQSWDRILVSFEGPNSTSKSVGATILVDEGGTPTLTYNYENPGAALNEELGQHAGTATLEYDSDAETLEGTYYTGPNRENYGLIKLERTGDRPNRWISMIRSRI